MSQDGDCGGEVLFAYPNRGSMTPYTTGETGPAGRKLCTLYGDVLKPAPDAVPPRYNRALLLVRPGHTEEAITHAARRSAKVAAAEIPGFADHHDVRALPSK